MNLSMGLPGAGKGTQAAKIVEEVSRGAHLNWNMFARSNGLTKLKWVYWRNHSSTKVNWCQMM